MDIVYFSWTGNTKKVVDIIFNELKCKANLIEIKPKRNYPYLVWLLLSFIPNVGVKINEITVKSNTIILCMPKWTLNCPPITSFLKKVELKNKKVYLVITYGGFDEKRYARSYERKIKKLGGVVKDTLLVKRSKIKDKDKIIKWVRKNFN